MLASLALPLTMMEVLAVVIPAVTNAMMTRRMVVLLIQGYVAHHLALRLQEVPGGQDIQQEEHTDPEQPLAVGGCSHVRPGC